MCGKGSKPRPLSIPYEEYLRRYDDIFKKESKEKDTENFEDEEKNNS
jgi:hypothetical protein